MEEQVAHIKENLMAAWDRQKMYVDAHRVEKQFFVGDRMILRVRLRKSLICYVKGSKLVPQFVGPFKILGQIGHVASRLALPPSLSRIYNVFHVSILRLYHLDISHVLDWNALQVKDGQLSLEPMCILQCRKISLRGQGIELVKVQWDPNDDSSTTWEDTMQMRELYPYLFSGFQE
ncbi:uncharacterized protein LOC131858603 [Cryptomeria japonica]|uniref:uncharacterized protein LOC131858603 n=1 Tax=Cryptomeria japonica TaxID=3369 RepID=UPI0027DA7C1D|nr:uncharacterized protein LOC131858603 [Cryptomeria japonica]